LSQHNRLQLNIAIIIK